jgi:chemotaxis protein CheC
MNHPALHETQLDALREVANIGAGHAATALSQMTSRRISISVPRLEITPLAEVAELLSQPDAPLVAVLMQVLGDVTGRALLVLPRDSGLRLAEMLMRRVPHSIDSLGEMGSSAMKETGNIVCAAYMNALSDFMGMIILLSVPSLLEDRRSEVLAHVNGGLWNERELVVSLETRFTVDHRGAVEGHFLLLPDLASLQAMLRSIRLT